MGCASCRTRCINPMQALEYLAGEKAVVSTPIPDIDVLFGEVVSVAGAGAPFVQACAHLLAEEADARCRRALASMAVVSTHSWARSADAVHQLLLRALQQCRDATPSVQPRQRPAA